MMKMNNKIFSGVVFFIFIAAFSRLLTVLPNFSAIEAIALFGGAYLSKRYLAFIIPVAGLYLSDLILNNTLLRGFYPDQSGIIFWADYMTWNIMAMGVIVLMASFTLKKITFGRVLGSSVAATGIFFLITNFGAWMTSPLYTKDLSGLLLSYEAGLLFLQNSMISSLLFSMILFGSFELVKRFVWKRDMIAIKETA